MNTRTLEILAMAVFKWQLLKSPAVAREITKTPPSMGYHYSFTNYKDKHNRKLWKTVHYPVNSGTECCV